MKKIDIFLIGLAVLALMSLLSSCSAIPTLPPPDSTVMIVIPTREQGSGGAVTEAAVTEEPAASQVVATGVPTEAATETSAPLPTEAPTGTPTATERPTATYTFTPPPTAAATEKPTARPTRTSTSTPAPSPTPVVYDYRMQTGSPSYLSNFAHPEDGCDWLGAAGQVFNGEGDPELKLVVRASGSLNGQPLIDQLAVTGSAIAYGPGGYELQFGDIPVETSGEVTIQLFDLNGNPLSAEVPLDTYASCGLNLILVNFQEK